MKPLIIIVIISIILQIFTKSVCSTNHTNDGLALRISEQKCIEYSSAVFESLNGPVLAASESTTSRLIDKCGLKSTPLILDGNRATSKQFPHLALLGYTAEDDDQIQWLCMGALISERYVLTSAHCSTSRRFMLKYVRIGKLEISDNGDNEHSAEDFNVTRTVVHPDFSIKSFYNDIALLELDKDVEFNPYKRPSCLAANFDSPEEKLIATSWVFEEWHNNAPNYLFKVTLDKFTVDECNEKIPSNRKLQNGILDDKQICAGSKTSGKDICRAGSDGPLEILHPTQYCMYSIVGISSFGNFCGSNIYASVYTRVYGYLDWIEKNVWG